MASNPKEPRQDVVIRYTNYRGETATRRIVPLGMGFGTTQWHKEPQWLLEAIDLDRDATRTFAMKDILEWAASPLPAEPPRMFTCTCGLGRGPYDPNHGVDCEFRQMRGAGPSATPSAAEPQKEE